MSALAAVPTEPEADCPPPYIKKGTKEFEFARRVYEGERESDVRASLGVKETTAYWWVRRLVRAASRYEGREVSYYYVLRRYIFAEAIGAPRSSPNSTLKLESKAA